ncbi:ABC transporter permease [Haloplasma contractile]|uniref:Transport permease protein n=1 Tax=Haloplasma contractile SSD-17B TaxID=1033810 RepID=F7Q0P1_9MOLU|nr:ABC transporter permease [Haloplasma contractile]ERJ11951.1 Putative integral membrane protein [Haloplasma contractile SSD-17B]
MKISRLFLLIKYEFKLYFREFMAFFFTLIFPIMIFLLFGTVYADSIDPFWSNEISEDVRYIDTFTPNLMFLVILTSGIMSLPIGIAEYREHKILKRYRATPISPLYLLGAKALMLMSLVIIGGGLVFLLGQFLYNVQIIGSFIPIMGSLIIAMIAIYSLGLLMASLVSSARSANAAANLIYFPFMFLSGTLFPLSMLPDAVRAATNIVPAKHAVTLLQAAWVGESLSNYILEIVVLIMITIVSIFITIVTFKWES